MKTLTISINIEDNVEEALQNTLDKYFGGVPLTQWIEQTVLIQIENGSLFESNF